MSRTHTTRAILDLEDEAPEFLFERVPETNAYLWPLARWPLAATLSAQNLHVKAASAWRPQGIQELRLRVGRKMGNPFSSDRIFDPVENLFIGSGTSRARQNRRISNWLMDYYAIPLASRAIVVRDAALTRMTPLRDRPYNPRTMTFDPALRRVLRETQLHPLPSPVIEQVTCTLKLILGRFGELLNAESRSKVIRQVLRRVHRVVPAEQEFIDLLDRVTPERIFMQTAAYGDRSNFIRIAHERDIPVIELQHGWIGSSHAAYNFGRAFFGSELTSSLPDTLFTFGDYWGKHLQFPGKIISIGKPVLESTAKKAPPFEQRNNRLLIVSSMLETSKLIYFAELLRSELPPSWEVAIRPHPRERSSAEELFASALARGVVLDDASEVSTSLARSRAVVGMVSTVLYEALPFGVHIAVIDTKLSTHYSDKSLFDTEISDDASTRDFAVRIQSPQAPSSVSSDHVWKPNAVRNFLEYVG